MENKGAQNGAECRQAFSFKSLSEDQSELAGELSDGLLQNDVKPDESTPYVSSGGGKKFGTAGNAGVAAAF